jgi:hypothetical protein
MCDAGASGWTQPTVGMHPNDWQSFDRLTGQEGFGIADAADGYVLPARPAGAAALPDAFTI